MIDYTAPDKTRCALVLIDAQRDFVTPGSPVRSAECSQTVEPLKTLTTGFREAGVPIFHMVRFYKPDGGNVDLCRRRSVEEGMRVLMPGSSGGEPLPEIMPNAETRLDPYLLMDGGRQGLGGSDEALYKPRWGAFYETVLETQLMRHGINTLVVAGCNFGTSGRATVLEASERDFRIVLVPDAAAGLSEDAQHELGRIGVHMMLADECVAWVKTAKALQPDQAA